MDFLCAMKTRLFSFFMLETKIVHKTRVGCVSERDLMMNDDDDALTSKNCDAVQCMKWAICVYDDV